MHPSASLAGRPNSWGRFEGGASHREPPRASASRRQPRRSGGGAGHAAPSERRSFACLHDPPRARSVPRQCSRPPSRSASPMSAATPALRASADRRRGRSLALALYATRRRHGCSWASSPRARRRTATVGAAFGRALNRVKKIVFESKSLGHGERCYSHYRGPARALNEASNEDPGLMAANTNLGTPAAPNDLSYWLSRVELLSRPTTHHHGLLWRGAFKSKADQAPASRLPRALQPRRQAVRLDV